MGRRVVCFEETPNPNALRCVLDGAVGEGVRSYRSADAARDDPLAAALFAVPGVTNVYINVDWLTVNKLPDASWRVVKAGVRKAIARHT